jgi:hypothetical protein
VSITATTYAKTRAELASLFGWNASALTPEQALRLDCATALRLGLDALQGALIRGETIDTAKMLTTSEALSRLLPAAVLAAPPEERRADPRAALLALILEQRERAGVPSEGTTQALINAQAAEINRLKARLGDAPTLVELDPDPRRSNAVPDIDVVPPGEIADRDCGMRLGPDDPKPPVTIEATAAPAADDGSVDIRRGFDNDRPEPWRAFSGGRRLDPWADNRD